MTMLLDAVGAALFFGAFAAGWLLERRERRGEQAGRRLAALEPELAAAEKTLGRGVRRGSARVLADYGTSRAPARGLLREAEREAELRAAELADGYDPASAAIPF